MVMATAEFNYGKIHHNYAKGQPGCQETGKILGKFDKCLELEKLNMAVVFTFRK
jgi:hypothetical protein